MTLNDIMTKNLHLIDSQGNITMKFVKEVAKQYSEVFARKSLEKASEEIEVDYDITNHNLQEIFNNEIAKQGFDDSIQVFALKHSITDIELPQHE